jgi:hypothetical protein
MLPMPPIVHSMPELQLAATEVGHATMSPIVLKA